VGKPKSQTPVIIVELWPEHRRVNRQQLFAELAEIGRANSLTAGITHFLVHRSMPVDIRHNAKIFREKLALWAAKRIAH
jgi:hypothetical protein